MVLLIVLLYANEGEYVMASIIILILKCFLFFEKHYYQTLVQTN